MLNTLLTGNRYQYVVHCITLRLTMVSERLNRLEFAAILGFKNSRAVLQSSISIIKLNRISCGTHLQVDPSTYKLANSIIPFIVVLRSQVWLSLQIKFLGFLDLIRTVESIS